MNSDTVNHPLHTAAVTHETLSGNEKYYQQQIVDIGFFPLSSVQI